MDAAGGLFFGWNALSLMIVELGNYSSGCLPPETPTDTPGEQ